MWLARRLLNDQLIGHILYTKLQGEEFDQVLRDQIYDGEDLNLNGHQVLYVMSMYCATNQVFMKVSNIIYKTMMQEPLPDYIFMKCFFDAIKDLFESFGGVVISKGPLVVDSGVKYGNKRYQWLLYKIDRVSLFSSNTMCIDDSLL